MNPEEYKKAIADIEEEDRNRQEAFDEETQAYLAKNATDETGTRSLPVWIPTLRNSHRF